MKSIHIILPCILTVLPIFFSGCSHQTAAESTVSTEAPALSAITTEAPDYYDPETQTEPVSVTYRIEGMGTVIGTLEQTLTPLSPFATQVEAVAKLGYRFSHWSDGSTDPIRFCDSFSADTVLTAYFTVDYTELPAVFLSTDTPRGEITKEEYVNGKISISGCDEKDALTDFDTEIRGRGHGSWSYAKKGWKLKLSSGQSLLGLGEGKSREWVLIANHIDRSLLRNAAATWIQNQLNLAFVPDYSFVDLYFNGEYMGVYQLCEHIEEDEHKLPITDGTIDDVSYFAELTAHAEDPLVECGDRLYEILSDLPDEGAYQDAVQTHLQTCYSALLRGDYEEIAALIDLDSVVDAYIVEELTKNLDSGWDSFYLYRNAGGKLTFGPLWDFDLSAGGAEADESSICYESFPSPEGLYAGETLSEDRQQNPWMRRFMQYEWFVDLVKERWQEVSDSLSVLPKRIEQTAKQYSIAFNRNFMRWKIMKRRLSRESEEVLELRNHERQVEYLADWYRERIEWLNLQWGYSE